MKRPDVPGVTGNPRPRRSSSTARVIARTPAGRTARTSESTDVRRFTARRRRRRSAWLLTGGTFVALVLIVTGVVMSPLLTLTDIVVKGRENVAEKVIVGAVSDQLGRPLASLDYQAIQERLGTVTRIESFTTEIQPPHTLVIRIVERQALGFLSLKGKWSVVDAAGVVIDTVSVRPNRLPELQVKATTDRAFSAIVETLDSLPAALRKKVSTVTAKTRDTVSFTVRGTGHRIIWGSPENSPLKVLVMQRALEVADRTGGAFEINVSAPDNIILQPLG